MNWVAVSSVLGGDLNGEAMADQGAADKSKSGTDSWSAPNYRRRLSVRNRRVRARGKVTAAAPRDAASGLATGRRMHKPFTITKEVDKASPLLMKACASGPAFSSG